MRIAQVAPPFQRVPPIGYGGTERVVFTLTEELVRRGHAVTLFASGDSETSAQLVPVAEAALWSQHAQYGDLTPFVSVALGKLAAALDRFDVVHNHLDHAAFPLARLASCAVVSTLHGRLDLPELVPLYHEFADLPLVSVSHAQRAPLPWANWVATVYHGIDVGQLGLGREPGPYLAFLGRISPEKGLDAAIRVAQRAGRPLKVGARGPLPFVDDPNVCRDWAYYHTVVEPLLGGPGVDLLGEVDDAARRDLLRNAAALLFPVRWPEPFGLVLAEALACGTPVLALRAGSVPELIEHGVTGFVCDSEDELVAAVGRLGEIDRARCRAEAERRFSLAAMVDQYERVYQRLVSQRAAGAHGVAAPIAGVILDGDGGLVAAPQERGWREASGTCTRPRSESWRPMGSARLGQPPAAEG